MALGRGLASLFPKKEDSVSGSQKDNSQPSKSGDGSVFYVEIAKIKPNPHQPRQVFEDEAIHELADSLKEYGVIQPLVVSKVAEDNASGRSVFYELIAGERRLRASEMAGLTEVPVVIRKATEKEKLELALIENIQRHDLNPMETAQAFKELVDQFSLSHKEIAKKMSKSRESVSNVMRLLALPIEIQRAVAERKISEGHARAILAIANPEKQRALFQAILEKKLTVRQAEDIAKNTEGAVRKNIKKGINPEDREMETKLQETLGTKVQFKKQGDKGRIVIEFYSSEELDKILENILD